MRTYRKLSARRPPDEDCATGHSLKLSLLPQNGVDRIAHPVNGWTEGKSEEGRRTIENLTTVLFFCIVYSLSHHATVSSSLFLL